MNDQLAQKERRLPLFPEIVPHRTGRLKVSDLHELYFEECGSPAGMPAVLLHGGPGGGINPLIDCQDFHVLEQCRGGTTSGRVVRVLARDRQQHIHLVSRQDKPGNT